MTIAESDKFFKSMEHRRERRAVSVAIRSGEEPQSVKAFGNPWKSPKDGKHYWNAAPEAAMRK